MDKNGTKSNSFNWKYFKKFNIFKDLGQYQVLIKFFENISEDENLQKFKPLIESFLKI